MFDLMSRCTLTNVIDWYERAKKWNKAEREIQKGPHENLQGFLDAVDRLRSIERFFSSNRSYRSSDGVLNHVNALLSKALVKMEDEFQKQLSRRSKPIEPDRLFDCLPSTLRPSSESHPEGGKAGTHSENQKNSEAAVYNPTAQKYTAKPVLLLWSQGIGFISCELLSNFFLLGSASFVDQVFCFAAITKNSLATLLSFGEAIAMSKRSPEKLFVLLDMYEIMCELQADIDTIFVGESCSHMRDSALDLTKFLAQTAQKTSSDFEEDVEKDATKNIHTDGTVHPLTSYVINYVKFLFENLFGMNIEDTLSDDIGSLTERTFHGRPVDVEEAPTLAAEWALKEQMCCGFIHPCVAKAAAQVLLQRALISCSFSGNLPSELGNLSQLNFL
ncbi:hypothetical protein GUJ93_ZPchr0007g5226 [Zizania palustris]|uniref:Exocyst subunit Exo70 family protein n=1 Tax=Zizania palustris TaxID=103762 RepID=A0A8J5TAE9_ZIZPA|nr:hypothetical protein GUJ93_ZPchr0007g5226 [Zizania palustris]